MLCAKNVKTNQKKWDPSFYHNHCILQYRTAIAILQQLALQKDFRVLDVGSGPGNITYYIAQIVCDGSVLGLDLDRKMVTFAKENYKASNLSFLQKNILAITDRDCFDFIVSFWTLSWVPDQALAIKNIVNALKPGGKMYLMYPLRHDAYEIADEMIKDLKWKKYFANSFSPRPFVTESNYRSIVDSVSEAKIKIVKKEIPCRFENREEMKSSIQSWMSYLDRLKEDELKNQFLDEFIEAYLKKRSTTETVMVFSFLEICGSKLELNLDDKSSLQLKSKL